MNMSLQAESELAFALPVLDVRGHGVLSAKVTPVFRLARGFFCLPREQKLALHMSGSPHFRGYTAAGEEITGGAGDWREQLDIGAERPALPDSGGQRQQPGHDGLDRRSAGALAGHQLAAASLSLAAAVFAKPSFPGTSLLATPSPNGPVSWAR
jgi:isopenicillin N synthase-like dioxygenase